MFQMFLTAKKVDYIFENLHCCLAFFLFSCGIEEKIKPSWRNYIIWTADWGEEHSTTDKQNTFIIFSSVNAAIQVTFLTGDHFCFISDCRNLFNCKLKKLITNNCFL